MHSKTVLALPLLICAVALYASGNMSPVLAQEPTATTATSSEPDLVEDVLFDEAVVDKPIDVTPWPGARVSLESRLGKYLLRLTDKDPQLEAEVTGPFLFHPKYQAYDKDGRVKDVDQAIRDVLQEQKFPRAGYYKHAKAKVYKPTIGGGKTRRFGYMLVDLEATNKAEEGEPVAIFHGVVVNRYSGTAIVFEGVTTDYKAVEAGWRHFRQLVESACDDDI